MPLSYILIGLVILFVFAVVPIWPYSRTWGLWPSGAAALVALVVFALLLLG